jgi:hypothetical protein
MKRLTLLKYRSDETFNASLPRFIALSLSTLYKVMKKLPFNSAWLSNTYGRGNTTKYFAFATEIDNLFLNCQSKSSLHRFNALIFFFVKVLRQWRQIREAMKR